LSPIGITLPLPPVVLATPIDLSPSTIVRLLELDEMMLNIKATKIGRRVIRERIRAGLGPDLSEEDFSRD
jgi:hypothetical protein